MPYYDTTEGKRVLDLENQITTLSANIYAAEYQWLCLLLQFDELDATQKKEVIAMVNSGRKTAAEAARFF